MRDLRPEDTYYIEVMATGEWEASCCSDICNPGDPYGGLIGFYPTEQQARAAADTHCRWDQRKAQRMAQEKAEAERLAKECCPTCRRPFGRPWDRGMLKVAMRLASPPWRPELKELARIREKRGLTT